MRQIRFKSVHPLWELDFWDGPLAGICLYRKDPYYFLCHDINRQSGIESRLYCLYKLTSEEFLQEEAIRDDFNKYVSTCHSYANGTWKRAKGTVNPSSTHHLFYDKWKKETRPSYGHKIPVLFFIDTDDPKLRKRLIRESRKFKEIDRRLEKLR